MNEYRIHLSMLVSLKRLSSEILGCFFARDPFFVALRFEPIVATDQTLP